MNIFGFNIQRREDSGVPASTSSEVVSAPIGASVQGRVVHAYSEQGSLSVPAFYRAITLRADTMARLTMQYMKQKADGHYEVDNGVTRGKHLNFLMQVRPNPYSNWTTLMRQAEISRLLRGNAYIYVQRGLDMEIEFLWLCSNGSYNPSTDEYTLTYYAGTMAYTVTASSKDVLHLRNTITASDGFMGMPLLKYAARTLNLSATQDQTALDTVAKGGRYKMLIQEEKQQNMGLGKVQRTEMEKARQKLSEDLPNEDAIFVPNVADVTNISQTLGEMELSTMRKLSVADISRLTAVPRNLLGDDSNSSYKTPEAATLDFLSNGIAPVLEEIEDEFNGKILGELGWGNHKFAFDVAPLFRLDRTAQGVWNKNRMETGVASVNELRKEQNLAPVPDGDDHYVSANLIKIGSAKLSGETSTTNQEGGKS